MRLNLDGFLFRDNNVNVESVSRNTSSCHNIGPVTTSSLSLDLRSVCSCNAEQLGTKPQL